MGEGGESGGSRRGNFNCGCLTLLVSQRTTTLTTHYIVCVHNVLYNVYTTGSTMYLWPWLVYSALSRTTDQTSSSPLAPGRDSTA